MGVQDYLYSEFDSEIIEEFLMMLDILEDNLDLVIEGLYENYEDNINELFRMFHNLKSATAFLRLERINKFSHFVENILDKARKKKKANEEFINWLFDVADQFHIWYKNINKNEDLAPLNPKVLKIPKI